MITKKASNAIVATADFYASALAEALARAEQAEALRDQLAKQLHVAQVMAQAGAELGGQIRGYVERQGIGGNGLSSRELSELLEGYEEKVKGREA